MTWFSKSLPAVLASLETSSAGLTAAEAGERIALYGPNRLEEQKKISPLRLLLEQFKNVLIITLLMATVISAFLGHGVEALAIGVIVLFAVLLGFVQEFRAEKAIEALRGMAAPTAKVLRDGREVHIPAEALVPGDVFLLAAGDRIPADGRLLEAVNLKTEESSLTGESVSSAKDAAAALGPETPVGDRRNMVFAGTTVSYGRGRAVAVATGMGTEFGRIAAMLQSVEIEKTPLQKNLDKLGKQLAQAAFVIVGLIAVLGFLRGQPLIDMLIFGIALAVAVVPEALPAVVTISLALGVQRMVKRHALMRRLPAVETLGGTTVICSDKTGTLTRDEMTVTTLYVDGITVSVSGAGYLPEGTFTVAGDRAGLPAVLTDLLTAGALCNDARLVRDEAGGWDVLGDPTEGALLVALRKAGLDETALGRQYPRLDERPFSSETKKMITLHGGYDRPRAFIKGAPETILPDCAAVLRDDGFRPMNEADRAEILERATDLAGRALRVLAIAARADSAVDGADREMTFLGLVGMIDPPREEAGPAVTRCLAAGIRPVMITGDHPLTAKAIARQLGILTDGREVTGADIDALSDEALAAAIEGIQVYARVAPEHKLRIIQALQKKGHIVAMTGDGVNDAPALKKANIGISMGITGTDVSKEASAMMLTDDNFASIVSAVEEGRSIYDNIKKYLTYLLSSNIGEIGLMAGATLLGMPLPLSAVQILYVNLATDGLPALALAVDPPDKDIMGRKPHDPATGIFTPSILALMLAGGLWSTFVNIALFQWARTSGRSIAEAMTMTFVSLVFIQFFKAYNFRSEINTVFDRPFANKWLNLAIGWEIAMLVLVVYLPFLHKPFGTFSLTWQDWSITGGVAASVVPVLELVKWAIRRKLSRAGVA